MCNSLEVITKQGAKWNYYLLTSENTVGRYWIVNEISSSIENMRHKHDKIVRESFISTFWRKYKLHRWSIVVLISTMKTRISAFTQRPIDEDKINTGDLQVPRCQRFSSSECQGFFSCLRSLLFEVRLARRLKWRETTQNHESFHQAYCLASFGNAFFWHEQQMTQDFRIWSNQLFFFVSRYGSCGDFMSSRKKKDWITL